MRILSSQLEHLGLRSARGFTVRMAAYLREAYADETERLNDAGLEAWVDRNVARAGRHAIDTEPEVAQYLLLCLLLGEDAPERLPWFRAPLDDTRLVAEGKVRALVRAVRAQGAPDAQSAQGAQGEAGAAIEGFVMQSFAT